MSNPNVSTPAENSSGNTVVGLTYMLLSLSCFIPYWLVLKIMTTDSELKLNQCYRIMFHMGLADMGQLIVHFCSGPLTLCQCIGSAPLLNKFLGAMINGIWMCVMPLTTLLAINRYLVICKPHLADTYFSSSRVTIYLRICWLYGGLYPLLYLTPWVGVIYYDSLYCWGYDDSSLSALVQKIEFTTNLAQMVFTLVLYVACAAHIRQAIEIASSAQRRDIRLLLQAVLIFCYYAVALFMWHTYMYWLPDSKWTLFGSNLVWIGQCGFINTVVYLTFNTTIRNKFWGVVKVRPQETNQIQQ